ncbi:uncharacterized protein PV09_00886 [Verruconis gallopava]|uniref:Uncharacterized protein n=1 Tax=Verruconis gallopava TaxID=253628 RepID=A0A0D2AQP2_9PEZI|nr:uncharacterized protein PV09_00886 [Verruconis gallopava]KIW08978.1 hypothetical protein PV09_00886 [Verruconis gallopava]
MHTTSTPHKDVESQTANIWSYELLKLRKQPVEMFSRRKSNDQESYVSQMKDKAQSVADNVTENTIPSPSRKLSFGSGAEQDRYAAHFGLGHDGLERIRRAASSKGIGAEQDRYASHFSLEEAKIRQAKEAIFNSGASGAEQDRYEARFGLGYDGLQRLKALVRSEGVGAEQDRYDGHFGLDESKVEKALEGLKSSFRR